MPSNPDLISRLQAFSRLAAIIVIVIGSLVTLGWIFNIALLKTLLPSMTTMKLNTALCFIASGIVLLRYRSGPSSLMLVCGGFVTITGLLTLIEYVLNWNLGIDQWLVYEASTTQILYLGRMSPMSALNFCLIGSSLLLIIRSRFLALAQSLAGIAALVALLSLTGYLYAVQSLYQFGVSAIALPTTATFILLCFAIFFAYPNDGLAAIVVTHYAGGRMARRALPAALIVPLALGWMYSKGEQTGLYESQVEQAVFAVSNVVVFTLLIFWTARSLNRTDTAHAVLAVQQEQADAVVKRYARRLTILREIDEGILEAPSILAVVETALKHTRQLIPCQRVSVILFDWPAEEWRIFADDSHRPYSIGREVCVPIPPGWREEFGAEPIRILDDLRLIPKPMPAYKQLIQDGLVSGIQALLMDHDHPEHPIGMLGLNADMPSFFTTEHQQIVLEIARRMTIAIHQLRLSEELKHRAAELERYVAELEHAESALRQSHDQLESQVQERTYELVETNQALEEQVIQRKRAEDQFRALLESAPDAVIIVNSQGEIILVNAQTEKIFGYHRAELLGKPVEMCIPENFHRYDRTSSIADPHRRTIKEDLELYGLRKDGSRFPVEISLSQIETEDGTLIACDVRDVTERKQVEVVLRENEEKLQAIFKVLPVGVTLLNAERQIVQINPALENILDLSLNDLMKGAYKTRKYIHSDGTPIHPNEFPSERVFYEQKAVRDVEIGVIKEDSATVWTSVSAALLPAHQGVVTVTVDITERKRAEQTMARLAEIVESSNDAIISKTLDGMITSWNAGAERVFGYRPEEVIGKSITILLPSDRMTEEEEILVRLREGEYIDGLETIRVNKHGQHIAVSLTISPMKDAHGRIIGASKIARDITERKQAEETLRESERQFRLLAQNSPDVIYVLDLTNQRATYLNRTEFLGYSQSELERSGSLLYALYPEDKEPLMAHWREITTGSQFQDVGMIEYRLQDKQGQWQWVQSRETIFASASDGTPTQILVTLSVITERKQAEQQAIELEKKQQRVKILSDFIRDTSHDFRTPLSIINTSLYLLSKVKDADKQAEYSARVYQQTARLTQMINQSLTMVRLDSDVIFEFQYLDLNSIIDDFCAQVRSDAKAKGITVLSSFWDAPLLVSADPIELGYALAEFGKNAVLYTPPNGVITIRVWQQDNHAVIDIRDTGIGIPEVDLPHIFHPLYRVDKARSLETGGGGLGLSIAKRIIELHQGHIVVESVVGEGSLFRVFLPLRE